MPEEVKKQIQLAQIVLVGLLLGQLFLYFFVYYMIHQKAVIWNASFERNLLYWLLPVFIGLMFWATFFVEKKRKEKFKTLPSDLLKSSYYRETVIIQAAIIEGINIFFLLVALFTFSYMPFMFFMVAMLLYWYIFPSGAKYQQNWEN